MAQFIADFPPTLGNDVSAGQHYMIIDSYESVNAITTGKKKLSSIGLYIPAGSLNTSYTGNYEGKEGASIAARTGAASGLMGGPGGGFSFSELASSIADKVVRGGLEAADSSGFISAGGNTPNNHMALVYKGPNSFRQHTFAFKFFPKNKNDSDTVRAIIEEFRRGTLPRMAGGASVISDPFFKSPRQHEIRFCKGGTGANAAGSENGYLFTIGTSVITNMQVNFDPQSVVGFHKDGSPVSVDLSLTFQEIKLQISQDNVSGQNLDLAGPIQQNQSLSATEQAESSRITKNLELGRPLSL